jgi:hypothetical protein
MKKYAGILPPNTAVAPIVNANPAKPSLQRHFSSFPMTSHLHIPVLRLVSLHPLLSLTISFLRVPEIHDGYEWKFFIARTTTIDDVIKTITEELGLTKTLPIPGGGALEYVLEEVWLDGIAQSTMACMVYHSYRLTLLSRFLKIACFLSSCRYSQNSLCAKPILIICQSEVPVVRSRRMVQALQTSLFL